MLKSLALVAVFASWPAVCARAATSSFHVGNSLTQDSQPLALEAFAAQRGHEHAAGYHLNFAKWLEHIWDRPNDFSGTLSDFGKYGTALPGNPWAAVTLQIHHGETATMAGEQAAALGFINLTLSNPANADTRFFIYSGWPRRDWGYQHYWNLPVDNEDDQKAFHRRQFYEYFLERVRGDAEPLGVSVDLIPTGEVLFRLDQEMRAGNIPGYTRVDEIYRDDTHLSYDVGRFVASMTAYSTIFAEDPRGLAKPTDYFGPDGGPLTAQLIDTLATVVWDVVLNHPLSGVALRRCDLDIDGDCDGADLDLLNGAIGSAQASAGSGGFDLNGDGQIDAADLEAWLGEAATANGFASAYRAGDTDLDRDVDITDFNVLATHFDPGGLNLANLWGLGNFDGDGDIDITDFNLLASNFAAAGYDGPACEA